MRRNHLLFLVILLEGYIVLACELLAIRQLVPFVGSGTEVVSIVISGVLLPLAVGYWLGGTAYARVNADRKPYRFRSIRAILARNIFWALVLLVPGLSYVFLDGVFFPFLTWAGVGNHLLQTAIYAALFLVVPVLLLGQTVPLTSHYFSAQKLSRITGRMLFFSTTGSFLGSIFSTLVLMSYAGVHNTVIVTLSLLALLGFLLSRRHGDGMLVFGALFAAAFALNSGSLMTVNRIVSDNAYNTIQVFDLPAGEGAILRMNRSASSAVMTDKQKMFPYIRYIDEHFIDTLTARAKREKRPRDILVLGAGGFTLGLNDDFNTYTFVDIDKALKGVAERDFLRKKLTANKTFVAASARAFVHGDRKQYDLIVLDTYTNTLSVPMETVTRNYLQDVKSRLKKDGALVANVVSSVDYKDRFSVRYQNTFASVFPVHMREALLEPGFDPWNPQADNGANVLFIYYNRDKAQDRAIYTDDRNTYSLDR